MLDYYCSIPSLQCQTLGGGGGGGGGGGESLLLQEHQRNDDCISLADTFTLLIINYLTYNFLFSYCLYRVILSLQAPNYCL